MTKKIVRRLLLKDRTFETRAGAKALGITASGPTLYLYMLEDPASPPATVSFSVYGEGEELPDNPGAYLGHWMYGGVTAHLFLPPHMVAR